MRPPRLREEGGFTLIELLVASLLSAIVFGAVVTTLVAYQNNAQRQTSDIDSQNQARVAIDRIVRELRNVAGTRTEPTLIEVAKPYDLVFQTIAPPPSGSENAAGVSRVRYCIPADAAPGSSANALLYAQRQTWTTEAVPANPWAAASSCPATSGSAPAGSEITTAELVHDVTNRYGGQARAAFTYDNATLSAITTIGVRLFVDVDPDRAPKETQLRSAAFLRNQNQAPVASFTASPTGGGHVLLNAGGSSDPDNQRLAFRWLNLSDPEGAQEIGSSGLLDWAPGPGTYTIRLEVTDSGGLISTAEQEVTVS